MTSPSLKFAVTGPSPKGSIGRVAATTCREFKQVTTASDAFSTGFCRPRGQKLWAGLTGDVAALRSNRDRRLDVRMRFVAREREVRKLETEQVAHRRIEL